MLLAFGTFFYFFVFWVAGRSKLSSAFFHFRLAGVLQAQEAQEETHCSALQERATNYLLHPGSRWCGRNGVCGVWK